MHQRIELRAGQLKYRAWRWAEESPPPRQAGADAGQGDALSGMDGQGERASARVVAAEGSVQDAEGVLWRRLNRRAGGKKGLERRIRMRARGGEPQRGAATPERHARSKIGQGERLAGDSDRAAPGWKWAGQSDEIGRRESKSAGRRSEGSRQSIACSTNAEGGAARRGKEVHKRLVLAGERPVGDLDECLGWCAEARLDHVRSELQRTDHGRRRRGAQALETPKEESGRDGDVGLKRTREARQARVLTLVPAIDDVDRYSQRGLSIPLVGR